MFDSTLGAQASLARRSQLERQTDLDGIVARYLDPIYRFLYSRVGNREDAEDLASEVFLKAASQLDRSRPEASIAQWLFTVARTVLADHWRQYYRGGVVMRLDDTRAAEIPGKEEMGEATTRSEEMVAQVLSRLPDRYRQVLELRFLQGHTIQETARAMGVTPENAKVLQHRALAKAVQMAEELP